MLRADVQRRKKHAENDRKPDQPHEPLLGMAGGSNSSWSEDCQYQREHYNARCRKGQELPARLPDTMNTSTDRQHDDQKKERNYCCHRSSSAMIAAVNWIGIWLA